MRNFCRLAEAKLHAVLSKNMYSEQGLEALIGPSSGQVCHSLIVVWYWVPGSAEDQAALAIFSQRSRARRVFAGFAARPSLAAFSFSVLLNKFQS